MGTDASFGSDDDKDFGLGIHVEVQRLNDHLGTTLVAALSGAQDRALPERWAEFDGPELTPALERRLRLAANVWRAISAAESDDVARSWFIGGNPRLAGDTPLTAIREDRHREAVAAVSTFLDNTFVD